MKNELSRSANELAVYKTRIPATPPPENSREKTKTKMAGSPGFADAVDDHILKSELPTEEQLIPLLLAVHVFLDHFTLHCR